MTFSGLGAPSPPGPLLNHGDLGALGLFANLRLSARAAGSARAAPEYGPGPAPGIGPAGRAAREGRPRLPAPLTAQDAAEEGEGKGEPDLGKTKMGCTGGPRAVGCHTECFGLCES